MAFVDIKAAVERLVSSVANDLILVRGKWGVGKTFYWHQLITDLRQRQKLDLHRAVYVSLFGISDIESVKGEIVSGYIFQEESTTSFLSDPLKLLYDKGVQRQLDKLKEFIPYTKMIPFGLVNSAAFRAVRNCVICFDDLERKDEKLRMKEVLGLAAQMKEQRGCKVVFLLNEDMLSESDAKDFYAYNEKLVDWSFEFDPSPDLAARYVFGDDDQEDRFMRERCESLSIRNVRVIKRIAKNLDQIRPLLKDVEPAIADDVKRSLVLFTWCQYDREANTPSFEFLEKYSQLLFEVRDRWKLNEKTEPRDNEFHEILIRYGYGQTDDVDKCLMAFVCSGVVVSDEMVTKLKEKNDKYLATEDGQRFEKSWLLYRKRFGDNKEEFLGELVDTFRRAMKILGTDELVGVVEVLRFFEQDKLADQLIDEFADTHYTLERVEKLIAPEYGIPYKVSDPHLKEKLESILATKRAEQISFEAAIEKVGLGREIEYVDPELRVLSAKVPDDFYKYFKSYSGEDLDWIVRNCLKHDEIRFLVTVALRKISEESDIDRLRVERLYGINPQESAIDNDNAESDVS